MKSLLCLPPTGLSWKSFYLAQSGGQLCYVKGVCSGSTLSQITLWYKSKRWKRFQTLLIDYMVQHQDSIQSCLKSYLCKPKQRIETQSSLPLASWKPFYLAQSGGQLCYVKGVCSGSTLKQITLWDKSKRWKRFQTLLIDYMVQYQDSIQSCLKNYLSKPKQPIVTQSSLPLASWKPFYLAQSGGQLCYVKGVCSGSTLSQINLWYKSKRWKRFQTLLIDYMDIKTQYSPVWKAISVNLNNVSRPNHPCLLPAENRSTWHSPEVNFAMWKGSVVVQPSNK